jgi:hypothetical protein
MAQSRDLRVRTTLPSTPSVGVITQYADPSGLMYHINENGTLYAVGQQWSGSVNAQIPLTIGGTLTGASYFLPVIGPSGQRLAIPAWKY